MNPKHPHEAHFFPRLPLAQAAKFDFAIKASTIFICHTELNVLRCSQTWIGLLFLAIDVDGLQIQSENHLLPPPRMSCPWIVYFVGLPIQLWKLTNCIHFIWPKLQRHLSSIVKNSPARLLWKARATLGIECITSKKMLQKEFGTCLGLLISHFSIQSTSYAQQQCM